MIYSDYATYLVASIPKFCWRRHHQSLPTPSICPDPLGAT